MIEVKGAKLVKKIGARRIIGRFVNLTVAIG